MAGKKFFYRLGINYFKTTLLLSNQLAINFIEMISKL
jgi:hypothetical protein